MERNFNLKFLTTCLNTWQNRFFDPEGNISTLFKFYYCPRLYLISVPLGARMWVESSYISFLSLAHTCKN